jgi:putative Mn2+ efflux pump MntP
MTFPALLLLALGLAMDAMAVSGARGLAAKTVRLGDALRIALLFGGFQAGMPAIGWALGATFAGRILGWGHWVTFVVLGGIGAKMLHEAREPSEPEENASTRVDVFGFKVLVLLAVATSIDALAAGVALAVSSVSVARACAVIGVVTAVLSFVGVHAGHRFGPRLGKRLEVLGGLVLIGLGIKAVVEHYCRG